MPSGGGQTDTPKTKADDRSGDGWFDVDRTIAFSDAVIAVAITLLVVTLDVPSVSDEKLGDALADLGPTIIAFVASFWLIAGFWVEHHQFGRRLTAIDSRLMRINLLFLFFISLSSFGTALFGQYADNPLAIAIYTVILLGVGMTLNWLWRYANRHDLLGGAPATGDQPPLVLVVRLVIFLSAIPLALVTPWAPLIWILNWRAEAIAKLVRRVLPGSG